MVYADTFGWRKAIRKQLKRSSGGTLRRRLLRQAVLQEHLVYLEGSADTQWWSEHRAEHKALFRRHLRRARKANRIVTEGKLVRLAP